MSEQGVKSGQPGRQAPTAPKQGPVTLRAVTPEDAPLYCRWMKDAFVTENYGGADVDFTEEMARGFFASRQGKPSFLILARPGDRPVGFCELTGLDETVRSATLGMFIGEAAVRGTDLHRRAGYPAGVWVRHAEASQHLAERLGGQCPCPVTVPPCRLSGGRPPPGRLALARKAVPPCLYGPSGRGIFRPAKSRGCRRRAGGAPPRLRRHCLWNRKIKHIKRRS